MEQQSDYQAYEYMTVTANKKKLPETVDRYRSLGWEVERSGDVYLPPITVVSISCISRLSKNNKKSRTEVFPRSGLLCSANNAPPWAQNIISVV